MLKWITQMRIYPMRKLSLLQGAYLLPLLLWGVAYQQQILHNGRKREIQWDQYSIIFEQVQKHIGFEYKTRDNDNFSLRLLEIPTKRPVSNKQSDRVTTTVTRVDYAGDGRRDPKRIRTGDIITYPEGRDLINAVLARRGRDLKLKVLRNEQEITVTQKIPEFDIPYSADDNIILHPEREKPCWSFFTRE